VVYYFRQDLVRIAMASVGKESADITDPHSGLYLKKLPYFIAISMIVTVVFILGMLKGSEIIMTQMGWAHGDVENLSDYYFEHPMWVAIHLMVTGCLLFFTGLLRNLPSVVLAAIVLVAVRGLFNVTALRHLWRVSRLEFGIAMVALVGVLLLGILKGVLLAVIVSVLMLLTTAARPHVAFLGRIPGTRRYSDFERHPDNEPIEHTIIFRVEASLLYFNVDHVRNCVWAKISETDSLRLVVCDLSNSPYVDVAGAAMLSALHKDLATRGIQLRIVEAHARTRDLLRAEGLEEHVGYLGRHMSVEQAIVEFAESAQPA